MKPWLVLADLEYINAQIAVIFGVPIVLAAVSIIIGSRKKKEQRSLGGAIFGIVSMLPAIFFIVHEDGSASWSDPLFILGYSPVLLGSLGLFLCLRRSPRGEPNQSATDQRP